MNFFNGFLLLSLLASFSFLIGYPLYRLLDQVGRTKVSLSLGEMLFVSLLLGMLTVGSLGLALLQLGVLTLDNLGLILFFLSAFIAFIYWKQNLHLSPSPVSVSTFDALLGILFAAGVLLYFHPFEFVVGGGDAGVYVNLGAAWTGQQAFWLEEPLLTSIPEKVWPALFRAASPGAAVSYIRLPGFYGADLSAGTVIPQFLPLHPLWLAMVHALLGLEASLFVTPLWAVLGVMAVALTLKQLFTWKVGVVGGLLLLITPLQIYFARYPTAEPLTQVLIWTSIYALARFEVEREPLWGWLSGSVFGHLLLTRIDALPLLVVPVLWIFFDLLNKNQQAKGWFFLPFGVTFIQALIQAVFLSFPYTLNVLNGVWAMMGQLFNRFWLWGLFLLFGAVFVFLVLRANSQIKRLFVQLLRWVLAVSVLGLACFAFFFWPKMGAVQIAPYWYADSSLPIQNHLNLQRLAWYLSPLGIWLAVGGIVWIILHEPFQHTWALLTVGLLFSVLYVYNIMNNPYHIYAMRRYVPIVVPFFACGMAYFLTAIWSQSIWGRRAAIVLGVLLFSWLLYNGRAVLTLVEYKGLVEQLDRVSEQLDPASVILFEDEVPVGSGSTFGTPLQYVYGFTAFDLQESQIEDESLSQLIRDWQEEGYTVYWVLGSHAADALPDGLILEPEFAAEFAYERLESSYWHFPERKFLQQTRLEFYRPVTVSARVCSSYHRLDVGSFDRWSVEDGFYTDSIMESRSVRWTNGAATLEFPCVAMGKAAYVAVTVGTVLGQPATSREVTLTWDGIPQGEWEIEAGEFSTIKFHLPEAMVVGKEHQLGIDSEHWIPVNHGLGADERELGVLIDEVVISVE